MMSATTTDAKRRRAGVAWGGAVCAAAGAAAVLLVAAVTAPAGELRAEGSWLSDRADAMVAAGAWGGAAAAHTADCDAFLRGVCADAAAQERLLAGSGLEAVVPRLASPHARRLLRGADLSPRGCEVDGDAGLRLIWWCKPLSSPLCASAPWLPGGRAAAVTYGGGDASVTLRVGCPVARNYSELRLYFLAGADDDGASVAESYLSPSNTHTAARVADATCADAASVCDSAYRRAAWFDFSWWKEPLTLAADGTVHVCGQAGRASYTRPLVTCTPTAEPAPPLLPVWGTATVRTRRRAATNVFSGEGPPPPYAAAAAALATACVAFALGLCSACCTARRRRSPDAAGVPIALRQDDGEPLLAPARGADAPTPTAAPREEPASPCVSSGPREEAAERITVVLARDAGADPGGVRGPAVLLSAAGAACLAAAVLAVAAAALQGAASVTAESERPLRPPGVATYASGPIDATTLSVRATALTHFCVLCGVAAALLLAGASMSVAACVSARK